MELVRKVEVDKPSKNRNKSFSFIKKKQDKMMTKKRIHGYKLLHLQSLGLMLEKKKFILRVLVHIHFSLIYDNHEV